MRGKCYTGTMETFLFTFSPRLRHASLSFPFPVSPFLPALGMRPSHFLFRFLLPGPFTLSCLLLGHFFCGQPGSFIFRSLLPGSFLVSVCVTFFSGHIPVTHDRVISFSSHSCRVVCCALNV